MQDKELYIKFETTSTKLYSLGIAKNSLRQTQKRF